MLHKTLDATSTVIAEELGQFEAIASSWSPDREQDTIDRRAFDQSIRDWQQSQKSLPVLLEHKAVIIGAIDPMNMHTDARGLVVAGTIDRESDEGRRAWRAIKSNTASYSIGFLTTKSRPREGGGRHLQVIDLLEISVVSVPSHASTRTLSWKGVSTAPAGSDYPSAARPGAASRRDQELRELAAELEAKRLQEEKRSRPIAIRTFEIG